MDGTANGADAVWMASENSYDGIVLDVMLPDTDWGHSEGVAQHRKLRR